MLKTDIQEKKPKPLYPRLSKVSFTNGNWVVLQLDDHRGIILTGNLEQSGQMIDVLKYAVTEYTGRIVLCNDTGFFEEDETSKVV